MKQFLRLKWTRTLVWVFLALLLIASLVLCWLVWYSPDTLGLVEDSTEHGHWLTGLTIGAVVICFFVGFLIVISLWGGKGDFSWHLQHSAGDDTPKTVKPRADASSSRRFARELRDHLRAVYTVFWRSKVRLLLVVGDNADVDALAPQLREHGWAEGHGTVLIAGGDLKTVPDADRLEALRRLARRRPLDGIIWVTRESVWGMQSRHREVASFTPGSAMSAM